MDIAPYVKRGIMSIFKDKPTEKTVLFVNTLARIVNKRLGELEATDAVYVPKEKA